LVPLVAGWSSGLAVVAYLIGGYVAALATGEGARLAEVAPVLDRSFPLEAVMVRRVRVLWPLLVLSLWNLLVSAGWGVGVRGSGRLAADGPVRGSLVCRGSAARGLPQAPGLVPALVTR